MTNKNRFRIQIRSHSHNIKLETSALTRPGTEIHQIITTIVTPRYRGHTGWDWDA